MTESVPEFAQETTCGSSFTSRPISIEAIRYDGTNLAAIKEWVGPRYEGDPFGRDGFIDVQEQWVDPSDDVTALIWDKLHDTWVGVKDGQWIIKGIEGEFYPCKDSVFQRKYQARPAPPTADELQRINRRLYATDNAAVWAEEYCKVNPGADEGAMIGWFANAIETAKSLHRTPPPVQIGITVPEGYDVEKVCRDIAQHFNSGTRGIEL